MKKGQERKQGRELQICLYQRVSYLLRFSWLIGDKITAKKLDGILCEADERYCVDARIHQPAYNTLVAYVAADQCNRDRRAAERNGLGDAFCHLPAAGA